MLTRLLCVLICRLAQPKPYRKRKWLDKISEKCGECPSSTWHLHTVHNGAKFLMGLEILHIYNFSKYFWNCGNFWSFYFYEKLPDLINFFTLEFWQFKKKRNKKFKRQNFQFIFDKIPCLSVDILTEQLLDWIPQNTRKLKIATLEFVGIEQ